MTKNDVLDEYVKVLRERGWCQGSVKDSAGKCCLVGARLAVSNIFYTYWDYKEIEWAYTAICEATSKLLGHASNLSTIEWNDVPGRTVEEVIALIEGCKDSE